MKLLGKIVLILLVLLAVAAVAAFVYYFAVTAGTRLDADKLARNERSLTVLDSKNVAVAELSASTAQKTVPLAEIPLTVRRAFIAAEDKNFYSHHGLDYKGMLRALYKNIRARAFVQGASTISQQLVKNTQLTAEKTLKRKLKEIKLTRKLEKNYTKDQILEMYLNTIYFGHSCYGITAAADYYFGKEPICLTPEEGAMLAAIIRSPNRYSPFTNPDKCLQVRNAILTRMQELGYLSANECKQAQSVPLPQTPVESGNANAYLAAVRDELQTVPLLSPYVLLNKCKVYTYMDSDLQAFAEQLETDADRSGKSILICDNKTHGAAAWFTTEGMYRRQPGSTIKPLAVYAPAIEENLLSPCTPVLDEKTTFGDYTPSNYKDLYYGYVSAREALSRSLNTPAVKTLNALGVERAAKYLEKMGLDVAGEDRTLALALGGMTQGYTLAELAGAYSVFACEGVYTPLAFIRKIEDEDGTVLYENDAMPRRVFSPDTVELVNDMLRNAATEGTAKKLSALNFPICAKTGTCGTEDGNTDAYTIAYTSAYTTAVWMGNADNTLTDITGGGLPCHYTMLLHRHIHGSCAPAALSEGHCVLCNLDKASYERDHLVCLAAEQQPAAYCMQELFRASNVPTQSSTIFTEPTARADISFDGTKIIIDLCQTEYYEYEIKRKTNSEFTTIFSGKCDGVFIDDTIENNRKYTYRILPFYRNDNGEKVYGKATDLPTIYTRTSNSPSAPSIMEKDWWEN